MQAFQRTGSIERLTDSLSEKGSSIRLRGGRMHNLQDIDLNIPLGKLVVICGVSGSGKSSLGFETLYAEGQRRYIESFSPYVRQFLPRREKPDYDVLDNLPAAVAVQRSGTIRSHRGIVGTAAEIDDYLRILYARLGTLYCPGCQQIVQRHDPSRIGDWLGARSRQRAMIVFRIEWTDIQDLSTRLASLQQSGFTRLIIADRAWNLATDDRSAMVSAIDGQRAGFVVVDRIMTGESNGRIIESLETALHWGNDTLYVLAGREANSPVSESIPTKRVDDFVFETYAFSRNLICHRCVRQFSDPEPRTFHFNSPIGACPRCEGLGLIKSADKLSIGIKETCPECHGMRLKPESLAFQFRERGIDQIRGLSIEESSRWFDEIELTEGEQRVAVDPLRQIQSRLRFLRGVGLEYLTLDRPLKTLSGGEATRVALTTALGSNLVSMLYVLDEPTIGLHARDVEKLIGEIERLRDRGNTVLVVEHESELIARADWIIELGPKAGRQGGRICFEGTPETITTSNSKTGAYLKARRDDLLVDVEVPTRSGSIRLRGACGRNLKNLDVDFPLETLCVVTGVSGSGKSTLVIDTLGAAVRSEQNQNSELPLPYRTLSGHESIDECVVIDQDPARLSPRGNVATYTKLFDDLRKLFADTPEAKRRSYAIGHFSFNSQEGCCLRCRGDGELTIDMQFLSDIHSTCPDCKGTRYRPEILEVKYRDRSIAECLDQSSEEAKGFFRGQVKLQKKLEKLIEIGLGYLVLGQSLRSLSSGEAQRLKLATYLAENKKSRRLFLMDEPTSGLHFEDVDQLIQLLKRLIEAGHSIIAIEHNDQFIRAAEHIIDLGPGAAEQGGQVIATGSSYQIAREPRSATGEYLRRQVWHDAPPP